jgi:hypothetical protein
MLHARKPPVRVCLLGLVRQVRQHGLAGFFGVSERFEGRAADLDGACCDRSDATTPWRLGSNFSIKARAREHDVGPNYEPKGVVGHDLYFDEYAEDRQDHDDERSNKPKAHSAHLPA